MTFALFCIAVMLAIDFIEFIKLTRAIGKWAKEELKRRGVTEE